MTAEYPKVDWRIIAERNGVSLMGSGHGKNVFIFPGMEGSGESCLHVAVPVIRGVSQYAPHRMLLIHYGEEEHDSFDALCASVHELVKEAAGEAGCLFWGQSFGNMIAMAVAERGGIKIEKYLGISSFTELPQWMAHLGAAVLAITPTFLYRLSIKPIGRWLFGPPGDSPDHAFFEAMKGGTSGTMRRRTGWLRGLDFSAHYGDIAFPSKVWLGEHDRLVNISRQMRFFKRLADDKAHIQFSKIADCGHVILDSDITQQISSELTDFFKEQPASAA